MALFPLCPGHSYEDFPLAEGRGRGRQGGQADDVLPGGERRRGKKKRGTLPHAEREEVNPFNFPLSEEKLGQERKKKGKKGRNRRTASKERWARRSFCCAGS